MQPKAGLQLEIILPLPCECWYHKCVPLPQELLNWYPAHPHCYAQQIQTKMQTGIWKEPGAWHLNQDNEQQKTVTGPRYLIYQVGF